MHIISRKSLKEFWSKHPDAEQPLKAWHMEVEKAKWSGPADVKNRYGSSVDILPNNRAVFDIRGNRYRLVVRVLYTYSTVYIRFVGSHADYDKIKAEEV